MTIALTNVEPKDPDGFLTPEESELNENAEIHRSLRNKVSSGRAWEDGLIGLVSRVLTPGPSGEPRWKRRWTPGMGTVFEFASFAQFIDDPNGLDCNAQTLIELLEASPDGEARKLSDQVRGLLKLPAGTRTDKADLADNIREVARENRLSESGTSAAGVRRRIRNWIDANPDHPNHAIATAWLQHLEANPRSRQHQKALREIGIATAKPRQTLEDLVPGPILQQLKAVAEEEEASLSDVLIDALSVYFKLMKQDLEPEDSVEDHRNKAEIKMPPPGFYSAVQLVRGYGFNQNTLDKCQVRVEGEAQVLTRLTKAKPFKILCHKNNPTKARFQVIHNDQ